VGKKRIRRRKAILVYLKRFVSNTETDGRNNMNLPYFSLSWFLLSLDSDDTVTHFNMIALSICAKEQRDL
jgi:hypothetical protein